MESLGALTRQAVERRATNLNRMRELNDQNAQLHQGADPAPTPMQSGSQERPDDGPALDPRLLRILRGGR
jgi:hypothetical protein